jgi:hypothetical protein
LGIANLLQTLNDTGIPLLLNAVENNGLLNDGVQFVTQYENENQQDPVDDGKFVPAHGKQVIVFLRLRKSTNIFKGATLQNYL